LDEEHAMQQSWRNDHDKLTFIACVPVPDSEKEAATDGVLRGGEYDGSERMVGDVNLFLSQADEDEQGVIGEYVTPLVCPMLISSDQGIRTLINV
jgi:hypothetical protein